jgi:hypothetical protein
MVTQRATETSYRVNKVKHMKNKGKQYTHVEQM